MDHTDTLHADPEQGSGASSSPSSPSSPSFPSPAPGPAAPPYAGAPYAGTPYPGAPYAAAPGGAGPYPPASGPWGPQGYPQGPAPQGQPTPPSPTAPWNGLCIAGFVTAFLMPPVGLALSIVALLQINRTRERSKAMAIAGIAVSAVLTLLIVLAFVLTFWVIGFALEHYDDMRGSVECSNGVCTDGRGRTWSYGHGGNGGYGPGAYDDYGYDDYGYDGSFDGVGSGRNLPDASDPADLGTGRDVVYLPVA